MCALIEFRYNHKPKINLYGWRFSLSCVIPNYEKSVLAYMGKMPHTTKSVEIEKEIIIKKKYSISVHPVPWSAKYAHQIHIHILGANFLCQDVCGATGTQSN